MEIFQIFVKRWRSLCSNLGGIDPEKPYRATLIISLRTYLAGLAHTTIESPAVPLYPSIVSR